MYKKIIFLFLTSTLLFAEVSAAKSCRDIFQGSKEFLATNISLTDFDYEKFLRLAETRVVLRVPQTGLSFVADKQSFSRIKEFSKEDELIIRNLIESSTFEINGQSSFREVGVWIVKKGGQTWLGEFSSNNKTFLDFEAGKKVLEDILAEFHPSERTQLTVRLFHTHPKNPLLSTPDFTSTRDLALENGLNLTRLGVFAISGYKYGEVLVGKIDNLDFKPLRFGEGSNLELLPLDLFD